MEDNQDTLPRDIDKANMEMSQKDEYHEFVRLRKILKRPSESNNDSE